MPERRESTGRWSHDLSKRLFGTRCSPTANPVPLTTLRMGSSILERTGSTSSATVCNNYGARPVEGSSAAAAEVVGFRGPRQRDRRRQG